MEALFDMVYALAVAKWSTAESTEIPKPWSGYVKDLNQWKASLATLPTPLVELMLHNIIKSFAAIVDARKQEKAVHSLSFPTNQTYSFC